VSDRISLLEQFARVLVRHGVEFLVIRGQAEVLMGSPRVTYDVDLCYRRMPQNLERLAAALREIGVSLRGAPKDLPFKPDARTLANGSNFTFDTPLGPLDLLGHVEPIGDFDDLAAHAESYPSDGYILRTISLDDLIRVKRHIARGKDSESLFQLLAIKRVREEMRGQGPAAAPGPEA
jgi:predicted nucleotidyltransferase